MTRRQRLYERDPRVLAARKQYRAELRAGSLEANAWERANRVYRLVRLEIDTAEGRAAAEMPPVTH